MSQRYVHILCVLLNYPMTVWRKEKIKREPASAEAGSVSFSERINFLTMWFCVPQIPVKFGLQRFWCRCESCAWGLGEGGCVIFVPDPLRTQCFFFNLLTSICTYKQCLQRNTFTGVDRLVHNYPYLERHGKLSEASHTDHVSDPSHLMIQSMTRVWCHNAVFGLNIMLQLWYCTSNIIPSLVAVTKTT